MTQSSILEMPNPIPIPEPFWISDIGADIGADSGIDAGN